MSNQSDSKVGPVLLPDAPSIRVDASADLGAARADWLMGDGVARDRRGQERAQYGSGVQEMCAVACSSAGIHVATARDTRRNPGAKDIRSGAVDWV
jgi:hypothetical protein